MKRFLYLFFALIIISASIFAVNFDNDIYVTPFVFGVVTGSDGQVLTPVIASNFTNGSFQTFINSTPVHVSDLDLILQNNTLVIFKSSTISTINKNNYLHRFYSKFSTLEYPDKEISILFKWS